MPGPRIDLHTHSSASDGTDSPGALMAAAAAAGLDVVALTDHDTTAGWSAAAAALPPGLTLVPGAEISCTAGGTSVHVLGYLFDPAEPELAAALARMRESRVGRAARMVDLLAADGHQVTWERVRTIAAGTVGRPHVAQALVEAGLVRDVAGAFDRRWIGAGGRYWVGREELDAVAAVRLVAAAGGVTVFAHPRASRRGPTVDDGVIEELAAAGLAGLEADHVDHDPESSAGLRRLAGRLGLLVTGSSDYHGTGKEVRLGAHLTAPDVLAELVRRASGCAVSAA